MPNLQQIQIRDPFVVVEGGKYYLFGSTDSDIWHGPGVGFDVYVSRHPHELTDYEGPFPAFRPPEGFFSEKNFWAPEVYPYAGAYYMFATFLPVTGCRGTAILRSSTLTGPYLPFSQGIVTPAQWECLDGTLYVDPDARPWMVFCHEWCQVGDGQICAIPLADDLSCAVGEPQLLFTASSAPWAVPLKGRAPGSYVTDGPYVVRIDSGKLLILWSSFGQTGDYCLGVATSVSGSLDGPWIQSERPLYESDGGHGMVFRDLNSNLWLAVHTPNKTPDEGAIFVGLRETEEGLETTGEIIS